MLILVIIIGAIFAAGEIQSARILGIIGTPSYSHQIAFKSIWKELVARGHELVVITTNPTNDPTLTNLTEIDVSFTYDLMVKYDPVGFAVEHKSDFPSIMEYFRVVTVEIIDAELSHPDVHKLIQSDAVFDVALIEIFTPVFFAFASKFNCPLIGVSSFEGLSYYHELIGNPTHPILYPELWLPFYGELNFRERLTSTLVETYYKYYKRTRHLTSLNELIEKHFGTGMPTIEELAKQSSLTFLNVNPILNTVRAYGPATIPIGGTHIQPSQTLPKDIQKFLDDGKNGVIYFSLGSNVKSKDIKNETMQIILDAFREIPFRVLWKYEEKELEGKPDNVKIVQWVPQQDVLRHPNIKLFITQCGIQSIEEAILNYVPMIGIPFYADQEQNLKNLEYKGIAIGLDHETLTKSDLKDTILKITSNKVYYEKVKEMGKLMVDQPMTGLERAVWWTEYVIRNKGAPYLRNPAIDIPTYQYYLLDVIAFLVGVMIVIMLFSYWSLRLTIKSIKLLYSKVPKSKAE